MDFETLYDLHTNPEKLYGYENREHLRFADARYAFLYARDVLEKPWHETDLPYRNFAEKTIASNGYYAYTYARDVLTRQPWHETDSPYRELAEKTIASYTRYAYEYALDVLEQPWHRVTTIPQSIRELAEETIAGSEYADDYNSHFEL